MSSDQPSDYMPLKHLPFPSQLLLQVEIMKCMIIGLMSVCYHSVMRRRQSWTCSNCGHSGQHFFSHVGPHGVFQARGPHSLKFQPEKKDSLSVDGVRPISGHLPT